MSAPAPIAAYDVWPDGRATPAPDCAPRGPGGYRWLHFSLGDPDLPGWVAAQLPELAADALVASETRPRCDPYDGGLILNLRGVNLNPEGPVDQMVSLRMWVTEGTVISVRMRRIFAVDEIRAAMEAGRAPGSIGGFLAELVEGLTRRTRDVILDLERTVETIEDSTEADDEAPAELRSARKKVIRLRRYLVPQREAVDRLSRSPLGFVTEDDRQHLHEGANLTALACEALEAQAARLQSVQDYADALVARRLGRNSYVLSLVAAVFLPLGFLTGLFGVNLGGMPGTGWAGAFAVMCVGLSAIGVLCLIVLKWLRLL